MKKYLIIVGAGIVVLLLIAGWLTYASTQTVAIVNGERIGKAEFYKNLEMRGGKQILDQIIIEKLILQEGKKNKISVSQKELETKLAEMKKRMGGEKNFQAQIKQSGYTIDDINKQLEIQAIVEKILGKDIKIKEAKIKEYYEQNKEWTFKDKMLDQVRGEIVEALKQQEYQKKLPKWIESLKKKAKIIIPEPTRLLPPPGGSQ